DPGCGEVEGQWRAEPTGADDEDLGGLELLLPVEPDLGHDDVPRVAGKLGLGEFDTGPPAGEQSGEVPTVIGDAAERRWMCRYSTSARSSAHDQFASAAISRPSRSVTRITTPGAWANRNSRYRKTHPFTGSAETSVQGMKSGG